MADLERQPRRDEDGLGNHAALQRKTVSAFLLAHLHMTSRTMEKPSKSISFHPTCCDGKPVRPWATRERLPASKRTLTSSITSSAMSWTSYVSAARSFGV